MPISTTCPSCKAIFRLSEELAGKKVKCQKCQNLFVVPKSAGADLEAGAKVPGDDGRKKPTELGKKTVAESGAVKAKRAPTPPDDIPVTAKLADDDDDDLDDDDDDDRRSRKRRPAPKSRREGKPKAKSGSMALVFALVGLGLFTCLGLGGAGVAWVVLREVPEQKKMIAVQPIPKGPMGMINPNGPGLVVNDQKGGLVFKDQKGGLVFKDQKGGIPPFNPPVGVPPIGVPPVPAAIAIPIALGADGSFRQDNSLTLKDPRNHDNKRHKAYTITLEAGRKYQIDMMSNQIDPYLFLFDDKNVVVAENDDIDPGNDLNSRIMFTPQRTAVYRIQAANFEDGTVGAYTLIIRRLP